MRGNAAIAFKQIDEWYESNAQIEVRDRGGYKGVFAAEDIAEDSVVFYLKGTVTTSPTQYTIQLGRNRHLNFPPIRKPGDDLDYCWQFLNHSCEPNGYMDTDDLTFRAGRNIGRGEEITFNYLTTESEMTVPFSCNCGSAICFGYIQGRNFLTAEQTRRLSLYVGAENVITLFPLVVASGGQQNSPSRL
jgi:hypothetical protein